MMHIQSGSKIMASISALILAGLIGIADLRAQDSTYNLAHEEIFGRLRRTAVMFPHEQHEDLGSFHLTGSPASTGCGVCHHEPDEASGRLVYQEGEEQSCAECHAIRRTDDIPALREAFHGNCTVCHRQAARTHAPQHGPTTCGGCHPKP